VIKRLLGKATDEAEPVPAGRLITSVDVPVTRISETTHAGASGGLASRATLSDADVERIAARVAEQIVRGPMADVVTRIVSEVSERLVREEIERVRAATRARS
jgi:hypothetical protein